MTLSITEDTLGMDRLRAFILQSREKEETLDSAHIELIGNKLKLKQDCAKETLKKETFKLLKADSLDEIIIITKRDGAEAHIKKKPENAPNKEHKEEREDSKKKSFENTESEFAKEEDNNIPKIIGRFNNYRNIEAYNDGMRQILEYGSKVSAYEAAYSKGLKKNSMGCSESEDRNSSMQSLRSSNYEVLDRKTREDFQKNEIYENAGISHMVRRDINPEKRELWKIYKMIYKSKSDAEGLNVWATMHR